MINQDLVLHVKLDRIDATLNVLFEYLHSDDCSVSPKHMAILTDSAMSELSDVRAILATGQIVSAMKEAV